MADAPAALLARLERRAAEFGGGAAARKLELLRALEKSALPRAAEVRRLHETLCFLRAYPDDEAVLAAVERMLAAFARRRDLRRHRAALENSGIAGTAIRFRFFAPMAEWLARRWPRRLAVDWGAFARKDRLEPLLPLLAHPAESLALDEYAFSAREWVRRGRGPGETDAGFLIRRLGRLRMDAFAREILYDELDPPIVLSPGPGTPSRTRARHAAAPVVFQRRPIPRVRPDLRAAARRPPRAVRALGPREARGLIDLAKEAMVTRERDLDVFSHASERDVRLVDCGDGLQFACMGAVPERRLMLEAVYGYLTLKNGVPTGYVLSGALFESAEVAFNVFETWRGGEAAVVFARALATIRHLFGARTFMIPPYQLGEGNDEAVASGAWWFYQKLGFRPADPGARRLMRSEIRRLKGGPRRRSSAATLRRLARASLYFHLGAPREDVLGRLAFPDIGLRLTRRLAERFGADREAAARTCAREAARLLGVAPARWTPDERAAWTRWSPLLLELPGIARWSAAERRAAAAVVRAKGGRRESDFVRAFDAHRKLRRAIRALAARGPE